MAKKNPDSRDVLASIGKATGKTSDGAAVALLGNATAKPTDGDTVDASEVQTVKGTEGTEAPAPKAPRPVKGVAPATPERVPALRAVKGTEPSAPEMEETTANDEPSIPTHTGRRSVAPLKGENAEINRLSSNHGLMITETKTARIYALFQQSLKADFSAWCEQYGLSLSEGLAVACRLCMERFPMDKRKRPKHRGRIKP